MKKKILVVDDDQDFKAAISILLEAKGYEIHQASSGAEGFSKARLEKPDLILLDVMMTHRTEGFDIAQKLHTEETTKDIPVIMVTGISKETQVFFKYEPDEVWLPVKEVLEKPVKPEALIKAVEKHVR